MRLYRFEACLSRKFDERLEHWVMQKDVSPGEARYVGQFLLPLEMSLGADIKAEDGRKYFVRQTTDSWWPLFDPFINFWFTVLKSRSAHRRAGSEGLLPVEPIRLMPLSARPW